MKILLLCNRVPWPLTDGGAIAMFNMIKGFHNAGLEVHLLCLNTKKHYVDIDELPQLFREIKSFESVFIKTDVRPGKAFINLFQKGSYHISRFWSQTFADKIVNKLQEINFDVIQIELLHTAQYLDIIRQHSKAVVSLRAHNIEHLIWQRMAETGGKSLKNRYIQFLAQRLKTFEVDIMNKFDAIIPISQQDANTFKALGCKVPIHVSPTGLDMELYDVSPEITDIQSLFYLGALNWMPNRQGLDWFLENVWQLIHKEFPDLKFYIAGRGMESWSPKSIIPNIELVGEVKNAKTFVKEKGLMIVPLHSGSGIRIKILEGMAMGKAIISTAIGAEGIGVESGENIVIADSPAEFVKAIEQLLKNPERIKAIGKKARAFAEQNFSNKMIIKKLLEFYDNVL